MTILKRAAFNWFSSVNNIPQKDPGILWDQRGPVSDSGVPVSMDSAMTYSAVYSAVGLISESIAALPAGAYARFPNGTNYAQPKPPWMKKPNVETNWFDFAQQTMTSMLLAGNSYNVCLYDKAGNLGELWPLDPRTVTPQRNATTRDLEYNVNGGVLSSRELLQIKGLTLPGYLYGLSPVELARQTIGLGLGAEKHSGKQMANSATPSVVVTLEGNANDETAEKFSNRFAKKYSGLENTGKPVVLGNGAKISQLTMTNDQLQFLEQRKFGVEDVARWFRVPPHMLGQTEKSTSYGTGIESQGIWFVTYTLMPWIRRIVEALSPFVPEVRSSGGWKNPVETYVKLNTTDQMRGDMAARADYMSKKIEHGAARPQDWNAADDENPLPGGDRTWMTQNMQPLDESGLPVAPPAPPAPPAAPAADPAAEAPV